MANIEASAIVVPCLTSCVSNLASAHSKGATIGVFRCLGALARALGPLFASTCDSFIFKFIKNVDHIHMHQFC